MFVFDKAAVPGVLATVVIAAVIAAFDYRAAGFFLAGSVVGSLRFDRSIRN